MTVIILFKKSFKYTPPISKLQSSRLPNGHSVSHPSHKIDLFTVPLNKNSQFSLTFSKRSIYKGDPQMMESNSSEKQVIDLQESVPEEVNLEGEYYFGHFELHLSSANQLKLLFKFKHELISPQLENEEITTIERNQYQLSKLTLNLTDRELTTALKTTFKNVRTLALFIRKNINNPEVIEIDEEKMTFKEDGKPTAQLYFSNFKVYDKNELQKQMKRFQEVTQESKGAWDIIDQNIVENVMGDAEIISFLVDNNNELGEEDDSDDESSSEESSSENDNEHQNGSTSQRGQKPPLSQGDPSQMSEYPRRQMTYQDVFKQNEIPIYERFRDVDINCSRKQKIKLSERMLTIGYLKQDIMKFFSGGAEEMEAQAHRIPDYRNPETARYKEIHMIVAKKQYRRHCELLKRHGLPPVQELPDYKGQITPVRRRDEELQKKVKNLLVRLIKEKHLKNLQEIHLQMKRRGVNTTLPFLKKLIDQMKRKSLERKRMMQNRGSNQINIDD